MGKLGVHVFASSSLTDHLYPRLSPPPQLIHVFLETSECFLYTLLDLAWQSVIIRL